MLINNANITGSLIVQGPTVLSGSLTVSGSTLNNIGSINFTGSVFITGSTGVNTLLRVGSSTSASLFISSSGNVGIGTTSSIYDLQIGSRASVSTATPDILSLGGTYSNTAGSNVKLRVYDDAGGSLVGGIGVSLGQMEINTWTAGKIAFYRGTTQTAIIDASGRFGINVNAPSASLQVGNATSNSANRSTVAILAAASSSAVLDVLALMNTASAANGNGTAINFHNAGNYAPTAKIETVQDMVTASSLRFYTYEGTLTEKVRITSSGSVGIGTTSPSYLLHLSRSSEPEIAIQNSSVTFRTGINSSNEYFIYTANAQPIYFATSGSERMRIGSGGDISIIGNTFNLNNGYFRLRNSAGNATYGLFIQKAAWIGSGTDYSPSIAAETGYGISFFTNGTATERMTISSSGNVGIGTTSPNGNLQFSNSTNTRKIVLYQGGNNDYEFYGFGVESARLIYSTYTTGDDHVFVAGTSGTSRNELMRIKGSGNLLIGQSTADIGSNGWQLQGVGGGHTAFAINNNEAFIFNNRNTGTTYQIDFRTNSVERGAINVTDSGTTYTTTSDYRVKEDFKDFNGLEKVNGIKVYDFKFKDLDERMDGVIAHELQEVLPYAVYGEKDGAKFQGVDYSRIVPVLIKAIQELKAQIDELKNK